MDGLLVAILMLILAGGAVVVIFPDVFGGLRFSQWVCCSKIAALLKLRPRGGPKVPKGPDLKVFNCRVRPRREIKSREGFDTFVVEVCGSVHAPSDKEHVAVYVAIIDVTEGLSQAQPVHSRIRRWRAQDSPAFCHRTDLGRIPGGRATLTDWVTVAEIELDWLVFPRGGMRRLRFRVFLIAEESEAQLDLAECELMFENSAFGYIDLPENIQRARTLAVALAFAVSAVDKKLYDCEIDVIRQWARGSIDTSQTSEEVRGELDRAFQKTVEFFREGNEFDNHKICREVVKIVPVGERYDILELCLRVAKANGRATAEELDMLKKLARWLEVDTNRFRAMVEKFLPVSMHEVEDVEVVLGVTSEMDSEETRQRLTKEYRKWNARVTSCDPEIQAQADQMLKFITEAKSEYAV